MSDPWTPSWRQYADQLDPSGLRYTPWTQYAPTDPYAYGKSFDPYQAQYEPGGMTGYGESFTPYSATTMQSISAEMDKFNADWLATLPARAGGAGNPGQVGNPTDPAWAPVNRWNDGVLAAVQQAYNETGTYVPPNVVKAIMKIESGGYFNEGQGAESQHGARGLLQVTSSTMGSYDYARLATDAAYGIYAGTKELALRYQDATRVMGGQPGWDNVAIGYFAGHYTPTGASDGNNTDYQYQQAFQDNMNALGGAIGAPGGATAAPNTQQFKAIWGGFDAPISQGYGYEDCHGGTDCYAYGNSLYDYGAAYTTNGQPMGHPGVDVGVGYGTTLYSPVSGTVVCAGTGYSNGMDACVAYTSDVGSGQSGRFEVMLSNGDVLILGHMSEVWLKPGQQIAAGTAVGKSGTQNGDHVHVEYRKVATGQTSSGYLEVDPRLALAGIFGGAYGTAPNTNTPVGVIASPGDWPSFMANAAQGLPISGEMAGGVGGFHDWLRNAMQGIYGPETNASGVPDVWIFGNPLPSPPAAPVPPG